MDIRERPIPELTLHELNNFNDVFVEDNGEELVPVSLCPEFILSRSQYFIQGLPGSLPECFLREQVYDRLLAAARALPQGYRFIVFDGWRSITVQRSLFDAYLEELRRDSFNATEDDLRLMATQFVALPSQSSDKPSPHLTGGAVDLSVVDSRGRMLFMGSQFDETTDMSRTRYFEERIEMGESFLPHEMEALRNRRILYSLMTEAGFTNYREEWWHFDYGNTNWAILKGVPAIYGKTEPDLRWCTFA